MEGIYTENSFISKMNSQMMMETTCRWFVPAEPHRIERETAKEILRRSVLETMPSLEGLKIMVFWACRDCKEVKRACKRLESAALLTFGASWMVRDVQLRLVARVC